MATNGSAYQAVIFDMDGLLIDTEPVAKVAWQAAARHYGHDLSDAIMHELIGRHREDCLDRVSAWTGLDLRSNGFVQRVEEIYLSQLMRHGIRIKPGVLELIQALSERRIPVAVATSTEKEIAPRKLRLAGLEPHFSVIITGCEVPRSKPAPDIFLLAANRLGMAPERCLALEDSHNGVLAASSAGMSPVMIPDLIAPTPEIRALTLAVFPSLTEAKPFLLEKLGANQSPRVDELRK